MQPGIRRQGPCPGYTPDGVVHHGGRVAIWRFHNNGIVTRGTIRSPLVIKLVLFVAKVICRLAALWTADVGEIHLSGSCRTLVRNVYATLQAKKMKGVGAWEPLYVPVAEDILAHHTHRHRG